MIYQKTEGIGNKNHRYRQKCGDAPRLNIIEEDIISHIIRDKTNGGCLKKMRRPPLYNN